MRKVRWVWVITVFLILIAMGLGIFLMTCQLEYKDSNVRDRKFTPGFKSNDSAPEQLITQNCFACHKLRGPLIGPGLAEIDSSRFFIYFNGEIINDPGRKPDPNATDQAWHQRYFQHLNQDDMMAIYTFVQGN